jgi:hypothetical protein
MEVIETAYDEIVDLFARGSSPRDIIQFHPSDKAQARARFLLDRNQRGELTADEAAELERLGQLEHVMQLVKARARVFANANDAG